VEDGKRMSHFQEIYQHRAEDYDRLVSREDYQGNILAALNRDGLLNGARVVEMGAGTGRLTRMAAPLAAQLLAFDSSAHMLAVAARTLAGYPQVQVKVADNRALPVADGWADVVMAGWSFGHAVGWFPDKWQVEIGKALAEMQRVARPGGQLLIFETLGTGTDDCQPPTPELGDYYAWLETEHDFAREAIRTDFKFASLAEAEELIRFFFGDEMGDAVVARGEVIVPECTGLWRREVKRG
jgi:ubiquinone/menaquinone biosynthesis C-methylase UbiE